MYILIELGLFGVTMLKTLQKLSNKRLVWLSLGGIAFFAVFLAHLAQSYLFMPPCEQCVYIRYAFVVLGIGCLMCALNPKNIFLRIFGVIVALYAIIRGLSFALTLEKIHRALQSDSIVFGIKGCSLEPHFDFGLKLHQILPSIFKPFAYCGYDAPLVPQGVVLSTLQEKLIALYAQGWYVIPSLKFGSMAECAFVLFVLYIFVLVALIVGFKKVE